MTPKWVRSAILAPLEPGELRGVTLTPAQDPRHTLASHLVASGQEDYAEVVHATGWSYRAWRVTATSWAWRTPVMPTMAFAEYRYPTTHAPVIHEGDRRCSARIADESDLEGWRYCRLLAEEHEQPGYLISAETRDMLIHLMERMAETPTDTDPREAVMLLPHIKAAPFVYGMPEDHACTVKCWENGCDEHETCTMDVCIAASVIIAEYQRQADVAEALGDAQGAATLRAMAQEAESRHV